MELLKQLTSIHAPSGDEAKMKEFILSFITNNSADWKVQPQIITDGIQDCIILVFGKPTTAVFAHIDSIGFTVGYDNELIKIGSPECSGNWELVGCDSKGSFEGSLIEIDDKISIKTNRKLDRGTTVTFKPNFNQTENFIQSPYLDNRLGCYNALKLAETLENGIICFSTYEEHRGGSAQFLAAKIYKDYNITQTLISDITWCTEGVKASEGVAISLRDSGIPRQSYLNKIIDLAKQSGVNYQLEVESAGGSDGNAIHNSPYPIDWCFIGAPESFVHSPLEKVHKKDIESMLKMYQFLMAHM